MFPACRTANPITSLAFRSRASGKSRHRQKTYQHQCQRTFSRRVGHLFERFIRLNSNVRQQKSVPEGMGVFSDFLWSFLWAINPQLPVSSSQLALFISYLSAKKLAPSTITSYLSAISYVHKIKSYTDPTKYFLIHKLLTAVSRQRLADLRLPITRPVLHEVIKSLQHTTSSAFQRCLYSAMFLLAFYGFFRVGELAATSGDCADFVLQFNDFKFLVNNGHPQVIKIIITAFKHNTDRTTLWNLNWPRGHFAILSRQISGRILQITRGPLGTVILPTLHRLRSINLTPNFPGVYNFVVLIPLDTKATAFNWRSFTCGW